MAEKEKAPSYEASATGQQQKGSSLQLPPLSSKQQHNDSDKPAFESYYLNIAQKGKLMLPTALWVMLILAGICFLTLLVSLNKTIGSIETLVELEQEREARAQLNAIFQPHHHHRAHEVNSGAKPENEDKSDDGTKNSKEKVKDHSGAKEGRKHESKHHQMPLSELGKADISDIEFGPGSEGPFISGSWFEFPSWTSLEPRHREQAHRHVSDSELISPPLLPPMSLLHDLFGDLASPPLTGRDRGEPEVSTSILLTAEPIMDVGPDGPRRDDVHESRLMDSIIEQTLPILGNMISDDRVEPEPSYTHERWLKQSSANEGGDHPHLPTISANIENLNVHINEPSADHGTDKRIKFQARSPSAKEEEVRSFGESIDDLVLKLIDEKSRPQDLDRPQQVEEIVPIIGHHHGGADHTKLPSNAVFSPLSPLSNLILPPGFFDPSSAPDSVFIQTIGGDDDFSKMSPHPQSSFKPMHHNRRPFEHQDSAPLVISISSEQDPVNENRIFKAKGEANRRGASNSHRPPFGQSPYEMPFLPPLTMDDLMVPFELGKQSKFGDEPHNEHHHVTKAKVDKMGTGKWDTLADNLADSFVKNLFRPRKPPVNPDEPQKTIIDGDMPPLAPGEQQSIITTLMIPDSLLLGSDMIEPAGKKKGHKHGPINKKGPNEGEAVSLFFGLPDPFAPFDELFQSRKSNDKAAQKPHVASTEKAITDKVDGSSKPSTTAPASVTTKNVASTDGTAGTAATLQTSSSAGNSQSISQPPTSGPKLQNGDKSKHNEVDDILNALEDIFTTPKFDGKQEQSSTASLLPSRVTSAI